MDVAVIIPVTRSYDIKLCLDSLVIQTYPHHSFEIILVKRNDLKIKLPITDIKISALIEENLHTGIRRNLALKHTDAQILAFLDDDTVPPLDWVQNAVTYINKYNIDGVCGPVLQFQNDFSLASQLGGAANESFFLEGFEDCNTREIKQVKFYNISSCNSAIKRKVWDKVGGFNESAYYYMDDHEFFYIADRLGCIFFNFPKLAIRHKVDAFPLKYLRKKFITRFYTGINSIIFYEMYIKMPFVRSIFLSYPIFILLIFAPTKKGDYFIFLLFVYFALSFYFSLRVFNKNKIVFLFLPLVFFLTHLINFVAFTMGIVFCLIKMNKFSHILKQKNDRFQKCSA